MNLQNSHQTTYIMRDIFKSLIFNQRLIFYLKLNIVYFFIRRQLTFHIKFI